MTALFENATAIGRPIRRKEDARLLTGHTQWTDNIEIPGMLHMAILRSPVAHARIKKLDVSGALKYPGVHSAYGAAELGALNGSIPCVWAVTPDMVAPDFPVLAKEKVRQVGDCVAVVLADSPYEARTSATPTSCSPQAKAPMRRPRRRLMSWSNVASSTSD